MRLLFSVFIAVFALAACSGGDSLKSSSMPKAIAMDTAVEQLTFNMADYDDEKAHYYSLKDNSKTIRFFLVKAPDGIVRAAFDACDVCYREKKGYRQDGNVMVCMNCGMRFALDKINHVNGGCNPSPLNRAFDSDKIVIKKSDIIAGGMYF